MVTVLEQLGVQKKALAELNSRRNVDKDVPRGTTGVLDQLVDTKSQAATKKTTADVGEGGFSDTVTTVIAEAVKSAARLGSDAIQGLEQVGLLEGPKLLLQAAGRRTIGEFVKDTVESNLAPSAEGKAATVGQAIGGVSPSFILQAAGGWPLTLLTFGAAGFKNAFGEAEEAGLSDTKQWAFALSVGGLSVTEALPPARMLATLDKGTGGLVRKLVNKAGSTTIKNIFEKVMKNRAGRAVVAGLQAAPEEAIQEAVFQRIPENALAKAFGVDDDRSLLDGTKQAAILGLIGGQIGGTAVGAFSSRGRDTSAPILDQLQEQETIDAAALTDEPGTGEVDDTSQPATTAGPVVGDLADTGKPVAPSETVSPAETTIAVPAQAVKPTPTVDDLPTAISSSDISKPVGQRVRQATPGDAAAALNAGEVVTSPEGTLFTSGKFTTASHKFARPEARRFVGPDVTVPSKFKRSGQEDLDIAIREGYVNNALSIAHAVNTAPRNKQFVLDSPRQMGLVQRKALINKESSLTLEKLGKDVSDQEVIELNANIDRLRTEFDQIQAALDTTGSEQGRSLRSRRFAIDDLFDLFTIGRRAKGRKGANLDPKENEFIQQMTTKLKETETKLVIAEKAVKNLEAQLDLQKRRPGKRKRGGREAAQERRSLVDNVVRIARAGCIDG